MSISFLAIYLTTARSISPKISGIIIATSALAAVFTSFFGGSLSDRYGRKKLMLISMTVWTIVFLGYGIATSTFTFFILSALNGCCRSFFEPTSKALLSDVTTPKNRLLVFNLRYGAINAGVAIGPLIGLQIGSAESGLPFFVAGLVYFIYMVSLIIQFRIYKMPSNDMVNTSRTTIKTTLTVIRKDKVFLLALLGMISIYAGYSQLHSTVAQYLALSPNFKNGTHLFSQIIMLNGITVLVVQYPLTRIGKRFSALVSIMFSSLIIGMGLIGFGISERYWQVYISTIIFTIGEVLMFSMWDIFIDEIAKPELKGTYYGAIGFSELGGVIGPFIGGILLNYYSISKGNLIFSILSGICVLGFPIMWFLAIIIKRRDTLEKNTTQHVV